MSAEQWNATHDPGVAVLFRAGDGRDAVYTTTHGVAWCLSGDGVAMVHVGGGLTPVALETLTPWANVTEADRTPAQRLARLECWLHARSMHPDYEYKTTDGPRKSWDDADTPPHGDGWEDNEDAGLGGWERFDYHEEAYWRRLRKGPA